MKKSPTQALVILVTAANQEEAIKIARAMVETKLAACANILPAIQSVYRWKGKIVKEREVFILLKSTKSRYPALEQAIKAMHSYEIPEIIALPITSGLPQYLGWIHDETHF
ncbi:MAG: divalent-cation tolerance protein CutA [Nitrospirae bacterium]|nr:divalent-cation tolerance protein CutA [Nitrospirota bacterium]